MARPKTFLLFSLFNKAHLLSMNVSTHFPSSPHTIPPWQCACSEHLAHRRGPERATPCDTVGWTHAEYPSGQSDAVVQCFMKLQLPSKQECPSR